MATKRRKPQPENGPPVSFLIAQSALCRTRLFRSRAHRELIIRGRMVRSGRGSFREVSLRVRGAGRACRPMLLVRLTLTQSAPPAGCTVGRLAVECAQSADEAVNMQTSSSPISTRGSRSVLGASLRLFLARASGAGLAPGGQDTACYVFQTFKWKASQQRQSDVPNAYNASSMSRPPWRNLDAASAWYLPAPLFHQPAVPGRGHKRLQRAGHRPRFRRGRIGERLCEIRRTVVGLMPRVDLVCLVRMPRTIEEAPNRMFVLPTPGTPIWRSQLCFPRALPIL